ncbi:hypothetical protein GIB67_023458 [Kingdonia uniflora]|uniref:3'-5' exonuclease domain-containing protein n=1 Tax=Kingdonia uniflora TaxID=39325 RepID=A0A7J7P9R2_9MAGN|nr:hypothetical protein GIB67_023458 [Kingdonia uniflora]
MSTSSTLTYNSFEKQVYDVTFNNNDHITTTVTNVAYVAEQWISEVKYVHHHRLHKLIVGLDIEWRPNNRFHPNNPVAILQVCVGRRCLIFQIHYFVGGLPECLEDFLKEESYKFVGVGIEKDIIKLEEDLNMTVSKAYELGDLAEGRYNEKWLKNVGLKGLAKQVLGIELEKPKHISRSNWAVRYLSYEQVEYATVDAFVSFEIGRILFLD